MQPIGTRVATLLVVFLLLCLGGCSDEKREEGRKQLKQQAAQQIQAAEQKMNEYDFDAAKKLLHELREEVQESPYPNVETYDKLSADIDAAYAAISDKQSDFHRKKLQGWTIVEGRFVSPAEQQRALAEEKHSRKEEANRKEEERRMAQARARAEAEARARAKAEAQARAKAKAEAEARARAKTEKGMRETLSVGYTSYCVWRAWYSDRLSSNNFLNKRPNAKWLFLDISVRNDDRKARMVPPFKLVDENGAEYESSPEGTMIENAIGVLESLNPSVTKQGLVVFDVPQNHQYRLKVSGGYWSAKDGFIRIVARSAP